jgi:hypothetical protein
VETMVVVSGGVSRCYLVACATFVRVGEMEFKGKEGRYPCIEVAYDLETLAPLSKILGAMEKRTELPEVFVWDEEKPEPEILILFRTADTSPELLRAISGRAGELLECSEVLTTGEANVDKPDLKAFLVALRRNKCAALIVTDSSSTTDDDPQTISRFIITKVTHEKPKLID